MATAVRAAETVISAEDLEALRAQIRGSVIAVGDPGFEEVRPAYNTMQQGRPYVAVRATGTADVIDAVNFAREHGMTVAVRGGGHSVAGLSTIEGGMLIDLSPMDGVIVDPAAKRVTAQGGALIGDLDRETQAFGLVTPMGVVSDTGVAGLTLGGGYGWLRRKLGLAADHLVEAQVVCADGVLRRAAEDENPDLLWALRGGGGNFGVVTSFTYALHDLGPIVGFAATLYPLEEIGEILLRWHAFMKDAPNEVTSVCVTMTFPANPELPPNTHDRPVVIVGGVYFGDAEQGLEIMAPLRELGTVVFDMSGPTPYLGVQTGFDPLFPRQELRNYWKSIYVDELTDEALAATAARAQARPHGRTMLNTFAMGGRLAEIDPEATAFSARSAPWLLSIDGVWTDEADDDRCVAWVRETFEELGRFGTGEVYLNFTGLADEAPSAGVDSALGRNMARLAQIKAQYDPDNFFRVNNNIAPAA